VSWAQSATVATLCDDELFDSAGESVLAIAYHSQNSPQSLMNLILNNGIAEPKHAISLSLIQGLSLAAVRARR